MESTSSQQRGEWRAGRQRQWARACSRLAVLGLLVALAPCSAALAGDPPPRPNFVLVLTDDQRFDTLDDLHSPDATPVMPAVIDRLAEEGVRFDNAFVTSAICSPSRASLLTGRNVFRHRVFNNVGPWGGASFDDSSTLAVWLEDAGYRTGFLGKYSNDYATRFTEFEETGGAPPGWSDWRAFFTDSADSQFEFTMVENGTMVDYGGDPADYSTDVLARQALDFVAAVEEDERPFFLLVSTSAPHAPWEPATRHRDGFRGIARWTPPGVMETDASDKPLWVQRLPLTQPYFLRRLQLEMLQSVDELVGALLDELDERGLADDTVFILTSDNGMAWGEHRWKSKACPWEECLRVPLVMRYPRLAQGPRVEDGMALNIDLAPTIAELAGVVPPENIDGHSLAAVLAGDVAPERSDFLFESYAGMERSFVGVRSQQWKLIEYIGGEVELYDLETDPQELESLAHDPAQRGRVAALRARALAEWPGWLGVETVPLTTHSTCEKAVGLHADRRISSVHRVSMKGTALSYSRAGCSSALGHSVFYAMTARATGWYRLSIGNARARVVASAWIPGATCDEIAVELACDVIETNSSERSLSFYAEAGVPVVIQVLEASNAGSVLEVGLAVPEPGAMAGRSAALTALALLSEARRRRRLRT